MHRSRMGPWAIFVIAILVCTSSGSTHAVWAQQWIAAWGSSMQGPSPAEWTVTNASVRMVARTTIGGTRIRVRLENTFGDGPLTIGAASIGIQSNGPALMPGSSQPIRFDGSADVTIPAGDYVVSDPVTMTVHAEQRLAVSLFLPDAGVRSSMHANGLTTSYATAPEAGNHTSDVDGEPFTLTTTSMHWLSAIEVFTDSASGAIVALGDSITDGSCATVDGYDRWEDVLYSRLVGPDGTARLSMVNAGIGGNTAIRIPPLGSPPGVERVERDVLSLAGVTHVVLFLGTNDLRRDASAAQVIAGTEEIVERLKARGLKVIGVTIIPRNPMPRGFPPNLGFNDARNAGRAEVNQWIRTHDAFDAVLDFDVVVKNPDDPTLINPIYDCDGIHPNVLGYAAMGRSVDLTVFDLP